MLKGRMMRFLTFSSLTVGVDENRLAWSSKSPAKPVSSGCAMRAQANLSLKIVGLSRSASAARFVPTDRPWGDCGLGPFYPEPTPCYDLTCYHPKGGRALPM